VDTGDTAWVLAATALVLFMTPGLALFYGGMVRAKNVLGMLMQNFFAMGILGVLWCAIAFSLSFGNAGNEGFIGNFDFAWMKDVGPALPDANGFFGTLTISFVLFCAFQMTFAIITPALITGATADRLKFSAYVVFISVWLIVVYSPIAHMVFAGGWLASQGALDFAGGAVVHMNAGAAALALVLVLGVRRGYPDRPMPPHSLPLTMIGTGILWFGWAGFNAGSALRRTALLPKAIGTRSSCVGRRCSAGCCSSGCTQVIPRRSAPRRVQSPVSSRSHRVPASSVAWRRSTSASSRGRSATER
jgi:Amt family ammonium transporter